MQRAVRWFLVNGFFGVLCYYWLWEGLAGAGTMAKVFIWVHAVGSFLVLFAGEEELDKAREKGLSVPFWVDGIFDGVILGALCYFQFFGYGALYLLGVICQLEVYTGEKSEKNN